MKRYVIALVSALVLATAAVVASEMWGTDALGGSSASGADCEAISQQTNMHASLLYEQCSDNRGGAPPGTNPATRASAVSANSDVIAGGEGVFPSVTQSEDQLWANGNTVVAAYNDSKTAPVCYGGGSYSLDGGSTWTNLTSRPFCSGHGTNYGDPVVFYDAKHAKWVVMDLATGCGGQGIGAWTSSDGVAWSVGSCPHSSSNDDRESGWVDNNPTSPFYGREYVSWNDYNTGNADIFVTYSDDGGTTWAPPVQVEHEFFFTRNVQITTGQDGSVFVASMDEGGGGFPASRANYVFYSRDGGVTWSSVAMGSSFPAPGQNLGCGYFTAMFPEYWRYEGWGDIGAGPSGVISYAFTAHGSGDDEGDIFYTRSLDNGATWSSPLRLNTDTTSRAQWQPSLSVSSDGHVYVGWYDQRRTTENSYERWGAVSPDNGATWSDNQPVSDTVSPLPSQPDGNVLGCYAGDYSRGSVSGDKFVDAWTDGRVLIGGVSQQDVFAGLVSFTVTPPPPGPPVVAFTGNPTSGDAPLTVSYTDQSTQSPTAWLWDFGDGGTSTLQNPTHVYTTPGTYDVTETATNGAGSGTLTKHGYIVVSSPTSDTTPPSTPLGFGKGSVGQTGVILVWTPSTDNVAVKDYLVFQDGVRVGVSHSDAFLVGGLTPSTAYKFQVQAEDTSGNVSSLTGPLNVRTTKYTNKATGNAYGTVVDATTGETEHGVTVSTTLPDGTVKKKETDGNGSFRFENLPPGRYVLTFQQVDHVVQATVDVVAGATTLLLQQMRLIDED